jgi:hypothetical protein
MKISYLFMPIFVALMTVSCSNSNNEQPTPKYYSTFGYFNANINGDSINIKNKPNNYEVEKSIRFIGDTQTDDDPSAYLFRIYFNISDEIELDISPETTGTKLVHFPETYSGILNSGKGSMINMWKGGVLYLPMKDAFNIQVDSIFYIKNNNTIDPSVKFVEGRLSGILYNEKNLKDSIVIRNAHFGVH